jgi:hypothetical protein
MRGGIIYMNKISLTLVVLFSIGMVYVLVTKAGISLETVLVAAGSILSVSGTGLLQSNKRREATITFVVSLALFGLYFLIHYFF